MEAVKGEKKIESERGARCMSRGGGRSLDLTPKSFVDESHQVFMAELYILKVRNTRRSGIGWAPGGRSAGLRVRGGHECVRIEPRSRLDFHGKGLHPGCHKRDPRGKIQRKSKRKKIEENTKTKTK